MTHSLRTPTVAQQIGTIIKDLRKQKHLTGEELGRRTKLSQSKISKIETGRYTQLLPAEIYHLLNILEAPKRISQQVSRLLDSPVLTQAFRITYSSPYWGRYAQIEGSARAISTYIPHGFPALLQTQAYRQAVLRQCTSDDDELRKSCHETLRRQDILWDQGHTFHFIFPETALYTSVLPRSHHLAQLDRLERLLDLPNVAIGIIPLRAGIIAQDLSSFTLYDRTLLIMALPQYEVAADNPEEIALHQRLFADLETRAFYGQEAKQLIRQAMDYFA